jgi:hypothetical protein
MARLRVVPSLLLACLGTGRFLTLSERIYVGCRLRISQALYYCGTGRYKTVRELPFGLADHLRHGKRGPRPVSIARRGRYIQIQIRNAVFFRGEGHSRSSTDRGAGGWICRIHVRQSNTKAKTNRAKITEPGFRSGGMWYSDMEAM